MNKLGARLSGFARAVTGLNPYRSPVVPGDLDPNQQEVT